MNDDTILEATVEQHEQKLKEVILEEKEQERIQKLYDLRRQLANKKLARDLKARELEVCEMTAKLEAEERMLELEEREMNLQKRRQDVELRTRRLKEWKEGKAKEEQESVGGESGATARTKHTGTAAPSKHTSVAGSKKSSVSRNKKKKDGTGHLEGSDAMSRTKDWVASLQSEPDMDGNAQRVKDLERLLAEKDKKLEELQRNNSNGASAMPLSHGVDRLKDMGLVKQDHVATGGRPMFPTIPPNPAEMKKLREQTERPTHAIPVTGRGALLTDEERAEIQQGKDQVQLIVCTTCDKDNDKGKKSGKFVKSNVKLKKQEQWPHTCIIRKYLKRPTFENLDFEGFVAGESHIIDTMENKEEAAGRLRVLCKIAHWYCRCKDWNTIRGLYEGIIDSIELGEASWLDDFSHFETMVPCPVHHQQEGKNASTSTPEQDKKRTGDKLEVYWCKNYNKGTCNEKSPHMAILKSDQPEIPVVHICAFCYQKENIRQPHSEAECPKKGK